MNELRAPPPPHVRLAPGMEIDGFRLIEKLHVGGMASLWRAERPDLDRPVVVKAPTILDGDGKTPPPSSASRWSR